MRMDMASGSGFNAQESKDVDGYRGSMRENGHG